MNASSPCDPRTLVLFGLPFHDVTMQETLAWIDHFIQQGKPTYLVTANLDFAAQASQDVELQRILLEAELVLCDGTPLVWASHLTGKPLRERVAGSDLVPHLALLAEKRGYRIFLLGGRPEVVARAATKLQHDHPLLPPVHYFSPPHVPLQEMNNTEILQRIQEARPHLLLVAFGCPKQEKWIYMHYRRLGVPVCIGVGATVDFLAGEVSRAPRWMARAGLEWVYRLAQEPARLSGRYAKDLVFLLRHLWRETRVIYGVGPASGQVHPPGAPTEEVMGLEVLRWSGLLTETRLEHFPQPSLQRPLVVDLSGITAVESQGLGLLLRLVRKAWQAEVGICFYAPSPPVVAVLESTRLQRLLPLAQTQAEARQIALRDAALHAVRAQSEAEALVVHLPARITAGNAEACVQTLKRAWEEHPDKKRLALSLAETTFIDSSGLGFLVQAHRLAAARPGAELRLLSVRPNVENVIRVARLDRLFLNPSSAGSEK